MIRALSIHSLLCFTALQAADQVMLGNGNRLDGEVIEMQDGVVKLRSILADEPLQLRADSLQSILFEKRNPVEEGNHDAQLKLINGDVLPGDLVSLNDQELIYRTWYAGDLVVPRTEIASLYLGVRPQEVLYRGPRNISGWEDLNRWDFDEGVLFSSGLGTASRKLNLPDQYIFSITIAWQDAPNCVIHLGSSSTNPRQEKSDEYLITFNSSGLDLKRHSPSRVGNPYIPIDNVHRVPAQFPDQKATIELRVNRESRELYLYLNGEKIGRYIDPEKTAPMGSYLVLDSRSSPVRSNMVTDIQVYRWDAVSEHIFQEETPDREGIDFLTTVEGDRYSGEVRGYEDGDEVFLMQSPLSEEAIRIPRSQASVIHFKVSDDGAEGKNDGAVKLLLNQESHLTLGSLVFEDQLFRAQHPLLGEMTLKREALQEIQSLKPEDKNEE